VLKIKSNAQVIGYVTWAAQQETVLRKLSVHVWKVVIPLRAKYIDHFSYFSCTLMYIFCNDTQTSESPVTEKRHTQ
jgi:hypothetical protein